MVTAATRFRRFSRFFTQFVGALDPHFAGLDLSIAEARLLYELVNRAQPLATDLQLALKMDAGFVSRVLRRFETRGWITRERGNQDGRQRPITVTAQGIAMFKILDDRQQDMAEAILRGLTVPERKDLVHALTLTQSLLSPPEERGGFELRPFMPGDMGLIASRQSRYYREVYGWSAAIETNIGEVTTAFLRGFQPGGEQCWVAEREGIMAGSVMLTDEGGGLCRLRLLYVEPFARGLGLGDRLVQAVIDFARTAGYREMTLWTHTILEAARRLYARHGFVLADSAIHETFGTPLMGETWRLRLDQAESAASA